MDKQILHHRIVNTTQHLLPSISEVMGYLKGKSSLMIFDRFAHQIHYTITGNISRAQVSSILYRLNKSDSST